MTNEEKRDFLETLTTPELIEYADMMLERSNRYLDGHQTVKARKWLETAGIAVDILKRRKATAY